MADYSDVMNEADELLESFMANPEDQVVQRKILYLLSSHEKTPEMKAIVCKCREAMLRMCLRNFDQKMVFADTMLNNIMQVLLGDASDVTMLRVMSIARDLAFLLPEGSKPLIEKAQASDDDNERFSLCGLCGKLDMFGQGMIANMARFLE